MKLQSSLEFLSTYSFMFILLAIALLTLAFLVSSSNLGVGAKCSALSGVACNFLAFYSSKSNGYSLVTLSIVNGQSVPINITNVTVTVTGITYNGICAPNFLYPGGEAACTVSMPATYAVGILETGYYSINAKYCNSAIGSLYSNNCLYTNVSYGGTFSAYATSARPQVFGVMAAVSNSTSQLAPFTANSPGLPNGYSVLQNGEWIANADSNGNFSYGFGSAGFVGSKYIGVNTAQFGTTTATLGNNYVSCTYPYNSVFSAAYTVIYVPSGPVNPSYNFSTYTDNAIEVYYKGASSKTWANLYGGSAWPPAGAVPAGFNSIKSFGTPGLYSVAVLWDNSCGSGLQTFKLTACYPSGKC